jgi:lipoprotein signal peptidase
MQIRGKAMIREAGVWHAVCTSRICVTAIGNSCDVLKHGVTIKYRTVEYRQSKQWSDFNGQCHAPALLPPDKQAVTH